MNIAEILKYCPKGTKLYSLIHGEVFLENIESSELSELNYPIKVFTSSGYSEYFTKDGLLNIFYSNSECVLFPSKEQRDWNEFRLPANDGDIMMSKNGNRPFIFKKYKKHCRGMGECFSDFYCGINKFGKLEIKSETTNDPYWTMDFIIPNKKNPIIIAESSFLATTSSGQGDKSKTEISIDSLIKDHYPNAIFIGFVDGIGWYVRKGDLKRMVTAYEDVFTFHNDELKRFEKLLIETFKK